MKTINYFDTPMEKMQREEKQRQQMVQEQYVDLVEVLKNTRKHPGIPLYKVRQALLEVFEPEELDMLTNYEL